MLNKELLLSLTSNNASPALRIFLVQGWHAEITVPMLNGETKVITHSATKDVDVSIPISQIALGEYTYTDTALEPAFYNLVAIETPSSNYLYHAHIKFETEDASIIVK